MILPVVSSLPDFVNVPSFTGAAAVAAAVTTTCTSMRLLL